MALTSGTRLGAYEIVAPLGAGGMGEVYRARDTNLDRKVAIKVLPESFAIDADRVARFTREAKTLAALNHPNIAAIYGLERSDGITALVMELVDGEDLSTHIARGPLPLSDALAIARQIAEALEAAHEQGIIHRDLKPANIKVRADGTVKVLDFGLAKAVEPTGMSGSSSVSMSPTLTSPAMTQMGMILGTAAYMSPEQAKGRPVDKRADIWAFGCVLYEMLTGARAFRGDDVSDTLAAVLRAPIELEELPADTPPRVKHVLAACLQRDPKQRVHDIADVRLALDGAFHPTSAEPTAAPGSAPLRLWQRPVPATVALFGVTILAAGLAWSLKPAPAPLGVVRYGVDMPRGAVFRNPGRNVMALSRDGRRLLYNLDGGLRVREMDSLDDRVLPGTEAAAINPFFSPDGAWVAFWQANELKRVSIAGGASIVIGSTENPLGATWEKDGSILVAQPAGLARVQATGGTLQVFIPAGEGERFSGPQLLSDGKTVMFTATKGSWDAGDVVAQPLAGGERTILVRGASAARELPFGVLVYARAADLFAQKFDAGRLTVQGEPVHVLRGLTRPRTGSDTANYAIADDGTLAYVEGGAIQTRKQLTWIDRDGRKQETVGLPAAIENFDLAPDDSRVVDERSGPDGRSAIWITDLRRGGVASPLVGPDQVSGGALNNPNFSPAGDRVAFGILNERMYSVPADGGETSVLIAQAAGGWAEDWSPDGRWLALTNAVVGVAGDPTRVPFDSDAAQVDEPHFSPDGRWLVYHGNRAGGGRAVYVVPFPPTGRRYPVSGADGGFNPQWRADGRELFYLAPDGTMMSAAIATTPQFAAGSPRPLFKTGLVPRPGFDQYAVDRTGRRFLVALDEARADQSAQQRRIVVVRNWFEELKKVLVK